MANVTATKGRFEAKIMQMEAIFSLSTAPLKKVGESITDKCFSPQDLSKMVVVIGDTLKTTTTKKPPTTC